MSMPAKPEPNTAASPWVAFEDRRRARDEKRDAILRVAVGMFLSEGYHRTTLNEIARRLNITKPALYNYFGSKEEILVECYRLAHEMFEASLAKRDVNNGNGIDRLRATIRAYALIMMQTFGMCLVRVDDRDLSREAREEVRTAKRRYDDAVRACLTQGIADGSISPRDAKLAGMIVAGALNAIGLWYRPEGEASPEEIADEFAARLTEGMAAS
jgi:AcrR family transcriptional regulator